MKKLLAAIAVLAICASSAYAITKKSLNTELVLVPTMKTKTEQQNRAWVGTFQIVWNDLQDNIVKGPIKFVGDEKNPLVKDLNKQRFKADMISKNTYYKTYGLISPELKTEIETAIMEKFNEKSDILDLIDWTPAPKKYLVYAMLKKDFKFITAFDKLKPSRFGKFRGKVAYFGIDEDSDKDLDDMINVLFYNSRDDFAVSIRTSSKDVVYLYRTDDNKPFDKLYSDMNMKKSGYMGWHDFFEKDELRIPDINLYKMQSFPEVTGKEIAGTDLTISDAIQTAEFKMNNEGVKLKSEAAMIAKMSLAPSAKDLKPRKFYFDDTFVLFLQEYDKKLPYFALRVYDLHLVNGTGKPDKAEEPAKESSTSNEAHTEPEVDNSK